MQFIQGFIKLSEVFKVRKFIVFYLFALILALFTTNRSQHGKRFGLRDLYSYIELMKKAENAHLFDTVMSLVFHVHV